MADGLAELQARWPNVPIIFAETRQLAEEWSYRFLAAAYAWASDEPYAAARVGSTDSELVQAPVGPGPATAEVRAWARAAGLDVSDRGRLRPEVWAAWRSRSAEAEGG